MNPRSALDAGRLSLLLFVAVSLVLVFACGGDEEEASLTPATTTAAPLTAAANCPASSGIPPEVQVKSYPQRPPLTIDVTHQFIAHIYTTRGHFIMELLPGIAPEHVNSFVFLARDKFFNGTEFHRVVPGFVAQGGDPTGTGSGGPGYNLPLEPSDEPFVRGVVGMARAAEPDSAGSQWFVTLGDSRHLDGQYTVFGKVTEGMEIVDCIQIGDAIITLDIQEI